MKSIGELVLNKPIVKLEKSERAQVIKEIYSIYTSMGERKLRKIENWKRYCQWAKDNRVPKGPEGIKKFKKTEFFIKESNIGSFCYFISHIKTKDLYYLLSVCKDKDNRGQSCGAWLFSSVKGGNFTENPTL